MPGKIQAFRELPDTMKQVTTIAVAALFISVIALITAMVRHGG